MANLVKYFALLFLTLSLQAVIAEETISDDDMKGDDLIPEDVNAEQEYVNKSDEEEKKPEEEDSKQDEKEEPQMEDAILAEGSGDMPTITLRTMGEEEEEEEAKCQSNNLGDAGLLINCQERQLKSVPQDLDASVTILNLSGNNIKELTSSSFPDKLDNLKNLTLRTNALKKIDKDAFDSLPRIESIDLSDNELSMLDPETFAGAMALLDLDLGKNLLQLPAGAQFLNVPALRRLSMVDCGLHQLSENTFDGMISLEELDLGGNPIDDETPIVPGVFAALTNLSALTLPRGASPALITEVCRSHGLLPRVCVGSCVMQAIPCHPVPAPPPPPPPPGGARGLMPLHEMDPAAEEQMPSPPEEGPNERPPPAQPGMKGGARDAHSDAPSEDSVPSSSRSGVSGAGTPKTIIGLVIGGMLAAVAAVVIKKNWSKIRGERDEGRRTGAGAVPPRRAQEPPSPEEVPLQNKAPQV